MLGVKIMVDIYILFLIFLVPGIIATFLFQAISRRKIEIGKFTWIALIFDLLILIINLIGLYFFKDIYTRAKLIIYFGCNSFTFKYAILSIIVGIVLAIILGLIFKHKHCHGSGSSSSSK